MHRKTVPLVLVVVCAVACAGPGVDIDAELERVSARSDAIVAAEVAQDTEAALAFWAPDAIVQPAGSPQLEGLDAIRELYDQFYTTGVLKEFGSTRTRLVVSQGGDMAWE